MTAGDLERGVRERRRPARSCGDGRYDGHAGPPADARRGTGDCQLVSSYASEEFSGGTYFVQAGFVENEIAATTYTLSPGLFPIRIDLVEALLGTAGTNVPTTTAFTIFVWDGSPDTGTLVRIAWHIGNRHLAAELHADHIVIASDHVIADMVTGLGGTATLAERPFQPEGGAYSGHGH